MSVAMIAESLFTDTRTHSNHSHSYYPQLAEYPVSDLIINNASVQYIHPLPNVFNIYIEGTIGEGKSTLCEELKKQLLKRGNCHVIYRQEKVDGFLLKKFYENPSSMEVLFQVSMMVSRIRQKVKAAEKVKALRAKDDLPIYVINDTGFLSNEAFILANYLEKHIDFGTFNTLMNSLKYIEAPLISDILPPTHIVLLHSNVFKCLKNISDRGRESEKGMPRNYIDALMQSYKKVYGIKAQCSSNITFTRLDTSSNFANAETVLNFVK